MAIETPTPPPPPNRGITTSDWTIPHAEKTGNFALRHIRRLARVLGIPFVSGFTTEKSLVEGAEAQIDSAFELASTNPQEYAHTVIIKQEGTTTVGSMVIHKPTMEIVAARTTSKKGTEISFLRQKVKGKGREYHFGNFWLKAKKSTQTRLPDSETSAKFPFGLGVTITREQGRTPVLSVKKTPLPRHPEILTDQDAMISALGFEAEIRDGNSLSQVILTNALDEFRQPVSEPDRYVILKTTGLAADDFVVDLDEMEVRAHKNPTQITLRIPDRGLKRGPTIATVERDAQRQLLPPSVIVTSLPIWERQLSVGKRVGGKILPPRPMQAPVQQDVSQLPPRKDF